MAYACSSRGSPVAIDLLWDEADEAADALDLDCNSHFHRLAPTNSTHFYLNLSAVIRLAPYPLELV